MFDTFSSYSFKLSHISEKCNKWGSKPPAKETASIMQAFQLCALLTLTFNAFFAASAPDRLSKVTNPTGWKTKDRRIKTNRHAEPTGKHDIGKMF